MSFSRVPLIIFSFPPIPRCCQCRRSLNKVCSCFKLSGFTDTIGVHGVGTPLYSNIYHCRKENPRIEVFFGPPREERQEILKHILRFFFFFFGARICYTKKLIWASKVSAQLKLQQRNNCILYRPCPRRSKTCSTPMIIRQKMLFPIGPAPVPPGATPRPSPLGTR